MTPPDRREPASKCEHCGHTRWRSYPRLDSLFWVLPPVLAALAYLLFRGWWWLGGGLLGVLLVILGRVAGGVYWWGGDRCTGCGHVEMLR